MLFSLIHVADVFKLSATFHSVSVLNDPERFYRILRLIRRILTKCPETTASQVGNLLVTDF